MDSSGNKDIRSIQLFIVEKFSLINYEEKELIRRFGWGAYKTCKCLREKIILKEEDLNIKKIMIT